jgi:Holliday junction resolvase RusA-like endonuclease
MKYDTKKTKTIIDDNNPSVLNLVCKGIPSAKQSFRFSVRQSKEGKTFVQKYQSAKVKNNAYNMQWDIKDQIPKDFKLWTGPIIVQIQYIFPITSGFTKSKLEQLRVGKRFCKTTKPDLDNLDKAVFDAMQGLLFVNDSQICSRYSEKIYGEVPMTKISIKHIKDLS